MSCTDCAPGIEFTDEDKKVAVFLIVGAISVGILMRVLQNKSPLSFFRG